MQGLMNVMQLPPIFLFRLEFACPFWAKMPLGKGDALLDLPGPARIDDRVQLMCASPFADVRFAWNDQGLGVQAVVKGKEQPPIGDKARPRSSDGLTVWIDTRDTRNIHRASRYCHQFCFLPTGGGEEFDEPYAVQLPIHRAQQDTPIVEPGLIPFRAHRFKSGYRLEAFLDKKLLNGYDPEVNARLGFYYVVRDAEHGEQSLGLGAEFPYAEDPSLWSTLALTRE